jgi:hypothetical protein
MAIYLKRSISKALFLSVSLTIIILIFFLSFFVLKLIFAAHKDKIETQISRQLNQPLSIGNIYYFPPSFIILKDVSIGSRDRVVKHPPLSIGRITLVFSLRELITKKNIEVRKIYFVNPKLDLFKYPLFLRENIEGILKVMYFLTKGKPLKVMVEDAVFILDRRGNRTSEITINTDITTGPEHIFFSRGSVDFSRWGMRSEFKQVISGGENIPLIYQLKGAVSDGGISITELSLEKGNLTAQFKGGLSGNVLRLTGFSQLESFYQTMPPAVRERGFMERIKNLLFSRQVPKRINPSAFGLNILNIDGIIRFFFSQNSGGKDKFLFKRNPYALKRGYFFF